MQVIVRLLDQGALRLYASSSGLRWPGRLPMVANSAPKMAGNGGPKCGIMLL